MKEQESVNEPAIVTEKQSPVSVHEKRSTRRLTGAVHEKNLCIWCMEGMKYFIYYTLFLFHQYEIKWSAIYLICIDLTTGADSRHPDRQNAKLLLLETADRWARIKASITDIEVCNR